MRKAALLFSCLLGSLLLTGAARRHVVNPAPDPHIDIRRSIILTDLNDTVGFSLERVLQALIKDSGATATTPLSLYQQWFDTQNPRPGLAVADAPHCNDFLLTDGQAAFNGFPRRCPTPEGVQATINPFGFGPFGLGDYTPIGITNRFDLAPADGSNCGQYRIVFANTTRKAPVEKLHLIFEAVLPNPNPAAGVQACRPVAQFWADLSNLDNPVDRRARLEHFFFDGIDGFAPVLRAAHFAAGAGRIRTLQQEPSAINAVGRFYQFQLEKRGSRLLFVPGFLENTPFAPLYNSTIQSPIGEEYRQFFVSQVATLSIRDVTGFFDHIPEKYLMHESNPNTATPAFSSMFAFHTALASPGGTAFTGAIANELHRIGSNLTVDDVLNRADMQNCHGCHAGNVALGDGITSPPGFFGTHIDELPQMGEDGVVRFWISDALKKVFAPSRAKILLDFLSGKPLPVHSTGTSIGGGSTSD